MNEDIPIAHEFSQPVSLREPGIMVRCVQEFLSAHRAALLDLLNKEGSLDRYQVEVHTLSGIARLFPDEARFMRLCVSPSRGGKGSVVMSCALEVEGQWFELDAARTREEIFTDLQKSAARGAKRSTQFQWQQERYLPAKAHSIIQPYLVQHFLPIVAKHQAKQIEDNTPASAANARPPRL